MHNFHPNPHSSYQPQWQTGSTTSSPSDFCSESPTHTHGGGGGDRADIPSPVFTAGCPHGGTFGQMTSFAPYNYSHGPFSMGVSTAKFSANQVISSNYLAYQQQQQQFHLQHQLQQHRFQDNSFGNNFCYGSGGMQNALVPIGHQCPSPVTDDSFDEAVMGMTRGGGASGTGPACEAPANIARTPVASRHVYFVISPFCGGAGGGGLASTERLSVWTVQLLNSLLNFCCELDFCLTS